VDDLSLDGLPARVRDRVVILAAGRLGALPDADVPASLRRVRAFTPGKRARLGSAPLLAALASDRVFRAAVVAGVRAGDASPADPADPVDAAAVAVLLGSQERDALLGALRAQDEARAAEAAERAESVELARLRGELARARAAAAAFAAARDAELAGLQAAVAEARRRSRPVEAAARRAEAAATVRVAAAEGELAGVRRELAAAESELGPLRLRVAELGAALDAARRAARGERDAEDARVRLLLDTLLAAGQGLRRALAPGAGDGARPGDQVAAALEAAVPAEPGARVVQDAAGLEALLMLPTVHVVVDGYNVTKTGYGGLTLHSQRTRLLAAMAALAARTGAEVTVVFDGAGRPALSAPARDPRGVRVAWSPPGVTADDVVLRFVSAEPAGRPVAVVSSDGEVIAGARRRGATPVTSAALLARLDRG